MIINDTEFNKKFTTSHEGGAIFIHRKNCSYWRISEESGMYKLIAWDRNYKYDVYFDNVDNLISFITK
jgi:hypothetical protein